VVQRRAKSIRGMTAAVRELLPFTEKKEYKTKDNFETTPEISDNSRMSDV
jgi:hypothetical protein